MGVGWLRSRFAQPKSWTKRIAGVGEDAKGNREVGRWPGIKEGSPWGPTGGDAIKGYECRTFSRPPRIRASGGSHGEPTSIVKEQPACGARQKCRGEPVRPLPFPGIPPSETSPKCPGFHLQRKAQPVLETREVRPMGDLRYKCTQKRSWMCFASHTNGRPVNKPEKSELGPPKRSPTWLIRPWRKRQAQASAPAINRR